MPASQLRTTRRLSVTPMGALRLTRTALQTTTRLHRDAVCSRQIADYADLVVMPTLVLDRLRGKGMRVIWSA
jgi:hypothetical protein